MAAKSKATRAAPARRARYAHLDDLRGALIALDAILGDLAENAPRWKHRDDVSRALGGTPGMSIAGLLRDANGMIEAGHHLRRAARRVLVAQYGARHARRWDGWKAPKAAA